MNPLDIFSFPVSALLGVALLVVVWLLGHYASSSRVVRFLGGWKAGAVVMSVTAISMAVEGTWGVRLHSSWPFFAVVILLQVCLGLAVVLHLKTASKAFLLSHAGMLLLVWASFWGAPDMERGQIFVDEENDAYIAYSRDGGSVVLPFTIRLEEFSIDYYEDGTSPRQYTSRVTVGTVGARQDDGTVESEPVETLSTSVNHPCRYKGYRIYQESYDMDYARYSVLGVVRDPWLPLVYAGMLLTLIGVAVSLTGRWKKKVLLPAVGVLAVVFTVATVAKISFGTLPPALRSLWFVPHLIVYMVAYSAMAIAVVLGLAELAFGQRLPHAGILDDISDRLLRTSSVLLLFGMLCGAVWAKQAWGDYWTWDPKECWAGVTWLITLVYLHLSPVKKKSAMWVFLVMVLAFLALQVTWYGVNYLPSAGGSMHTYNN